MRVLVLASGSSGNAAVVEAGGTRILIDCGLSLRQMEQRLCALGSSLDGVTAVIVTHEHSDHCAGLDVLRRRRGVPLMTTAGTARALGVEVEMMEELTPGREIRIGELRLLPVATSHDAAAGIALVLSHGCCRLGVVTDTGTVSGAMIEALSGCHGLLIEANHDTDMLRLGSYPWPLKRRIASALGHLSNEQARQAVERLAHPALEVVVGMHLSRENNRAALALSELASALTGSAVAVALADQFEALAVEVHGGTAPGGQLPLFSDDGGDASWTPRQAKG